MNQTVPTYETTPSIPDWDGSIVGARALQLQLAQRVLLRDGFARPLRTVAGFDVGIEDGGGIVRATAVLLDADTLALIDTQVARVATTMPDIADLLSFRELPALLAVLALLPQRPDLALVDGHGIAHPGRFGVAAHFGVAADLPSIGVAKSVLVGTGPTPHLIRGAYTSLRDGREQIGWLLRSKPDCDALVVSPGHRVAMASTADMVMRYVTRHRLPEPIRLADSPVADRDRGPA